MTRIEDLHDRVAHRVALLECGPIGLAVAGALRLASAKRTLELRVVQSARENVGERRDRRAGHAREIVDEVVLEFVVDDARAAGDAVERRKRHVLHLRAARLETVDRGAHDTCGLLVVGFGSEVRRQHAEPGAAKGRRVERGNESRHRSAGKDTRGRICRVGADGCVEADCEISHGARQRPAHVLRVRKRNDAVDARQPFRRSQPEEVLIRRRDSDRATGVRSPRDRREARRDRRRAATARAAGVAVGIVRVAGLAA